MRLPRVCLHAPARRGERIELPPEEARHLAVVLRRGAGDHVRLIGAAGGAWEGVVAAVEAGRGGVPRVVVEVLGEAGGEPAPIVPWSVAAAVVKGSGFDLAVRMASELGLARLIPLWTARTEVRPGGHRARGGGKEERWRRLAREAAKQCGRAAPLEVGAGTSFATFVEESGARPHGQLWIAVPGAELPPPGDFFSRGSRSPEVATDLPPALFLVGPEGGFTAEEVQGAREAGFRPLGFPTPILRTPTAIVLLAALGLVLAAGEAPERQPPPGS